MPETVGICVLCGSADLVRWKHFGEWCIDQCCSCGLAVLNPHPTDMEMVEIYNGYWGYPPKPTEFEEKAREVAAQTGRVQQIGRFKAHGGRWLDVGAGSGTLLVRARQEGWEVYGCEIAGHLVKYAAQEYNLALFQGILQEYDVPVLFDVISMYHLLEHVASPVDLLRPAHERLADDGMLVVEVPNVASLDAKLEGARWANWSLPVHFYHFTPDTLTRMLNHTGFQVVSLEIAPSNYADKWWYRLVQRLTPAFAQELLLAGGIMGCLACKG